MKSSDQVYLKPNAVCEPVINRWYAWPYLVSPATAAMYMANHHVRMLQAFVAAPQVHVEALKKPEMIGGPFLNYGPERVPDVQNLLASTKREQADLLELAAAFKNLNTLLSECAGESLEPLYPQVPQRLRGYVELVYDLSHRPNFRILEPLLYESEYYKPASQSFGLFTIHGDERSFALSTPRLDWSDVSFASLPFASPVVDELAAARHTPKELGFFEDCLRITDRSAVGNLFTLDAPKPNPVQVESGAVRIRYFGHACLLLQSSRASVLIDPLVPYTGYANDGRFGFQDLPSRIDYVLLTHSHQDHVLLETLLQLRHRIDTLVVPANEPGNLADPSLKLMFRKLGFRNIVSLDDMDTVEFEGGSITALPFLGEHGDLDVRSKAAHLVRMEGRAVLCAADSNNVEPELYAHLRGVVGQLDALFIGMECQGAPMSWLYGPLFSKPIIRKHDQSRRLDGSDYAKAIDIVDRLKPRETYVYAMGAEPWLEFISSIRYTESSLPIVESNRLVEECRRRGITSERLYGGRDIHL